MDVVAIVVVVAVVVVVVVVRTLLKHVRISPCPCTLAS